MGVALGQVEDGVYSACCQNGLGTARGTASGMAIAELATLGTTDLAGYFLEQGQPSKLPPAPFDSIGATAIMRWNEFRAKEEL